MSIRLLDNIHRGRLLSCKKEEVWEDEQDELS